MTRPEPERPLLPASRGAYLELLGLVGFLGLGWVYAGQTGTGLLLMLVWWTAAAVAFVLLAGSAFFSRSLFFSLLAFCALAWLAIPTASALSVRSRLRQGQGRTGHNDKSRHE